MARDKGAFLQPSINSRFHNVLKRHICIKMNRIFWKDNLVWQCTCAYAPSELEADAAPTRMRRWRVEIDD